MPRKIVSEKVTPKFVLDLSDRGTWLMSMSPSPGFNGSGDHYSIHFVATDTKRSLCGLANWNKLIPVVSQLPSKPCPRCIGQLITYGYIDFEIV